MKYYEPEDTYSNCSNCHKRKLDDDLCHTCGGCEKCCNCPSFVEPDEAENTTIPASWDTPAFIWDDEEIYLSYDGECVMCGKERPVNDEGYCSSCWQVWNS